MKNLEIKSVSNSSIIVSYGRVPGRIVPYEINYLINGKIAKGKVQIKLPQYGRPPRASLRNACEMGISNGFRLVCTTNGEYAYVNSYGNLLPYRYDWSSGFNEHGLAMAAKDGCVSWINDAFEYMPSEGGFIPEDLSNPHRKFVAFKEVNAYSKNRFPLSRVRDINGEYSYLTLEGEKRAFYIFDGKNMTCISNFTMASDFDINGMACITIGEENFVLFETGYCLSMLDYLMRCKDKIFMQMLMQERIEKTFGKKVLCQK
jgi:hypothetical protein